MNMLIAVLLLGVSFYFLFLCSQKQRMKTLQTRWKYLAANVLITRISSCILMLISILLLCLNWGNAIGWVSFFIVSSPLLFLIILSINDLKSKSIKT